MSTVHSDMLCLRQKNDTAKEVIKFLKMFKNQTTLNMKCFKSDNGTEFIGAELKEFFENEGIIHKTTAPLNPESNGFIERDMRVLKEASRFMMQKAKVPEFLWAEAVNTAVSYLNRLPNSQNPSMTAFEFVFRRKPNLSRMGTFGCTA